MNVAPTLAERLVKGLRPGKMLYRYAAWRTRRTVVEGPFAGLVLKENSTWGASTAKLLGTYERELHPALNAAIRSRPKLIIDIGGAEGYYAVGLAARVPLSSVFVFECQAPARLSLYRNAQANGVEDRICILGACTQAQLASILITTNDEKGMMICDIEGGELDLFNRDIARMAKNLTCFIEIHDHPSADALNCLTQVFAETHSCRFHPIESRTASDATEEPLRYFAPSLVRRYMVNEFRSRSIGWLVCHAENRIG